VSISYAQSDPWPVVCKPDDWIKTQSLDRWGKGDRKETGGFSLSNESDHESTPSFSKIKIIKEQA